MVVIEARPLVEQVGHLRLRARCAEIAPAIDRVHFGRIARRVGLDDRHRPFVRPGRRPERGERGGETSMVRVDAFTPRAQAGTAADLLAEAGALALGVET